MNIFNFFKKKKPIDQQTENRKTEVDKSLWLGKNFEFLIRGEIELTPENHDEIMTPNTIVWQKIMKDDYPYYKVGEDEFSYSWEMPGIQMTFNPEIKYAKAKKIADEVMENLNNAGQSAELVELQSNTVYSFS